MEKKPGHFYPLYAAAISDAVRGPGASLDELITLRDHARAILSQQGDLAGSLAKLEAEIAKRSG